MRRRKRSGKTGQIGRKENRYRGREGLLGIDWIRRVIRTCRVMIPSLFTLVSEGIKRLLVGRLRWLRSFFFITNYMEKKENISKFFFSLPLLTLDLLLRVFQEYRQTGTLRSITKLLQLVNNVPMMSQYFRHAYAVPTSPSALCLTSGRLIFNKTRER